MYFRSEYGFKLALQLVFLMFFRLANYMDFFFLDLFDNIFCVEKSLESFT